MQQDLKGNLIMKKHVAIVLMLLVCSSINLEVKAQSEFSSAEFLKAAKASMKELIIDYQNVGMCKAPKNNLGFKILGISNGKCQYEYMGRTCYAPMSSVKEYSSKMIAEANRMISEIDKGRFSMHASVDVFGQNLFKDGVCK